MADVNINAPAEQAPTMAPPTRTNDQILPHIRWCQLDEQWFDLTKDTLKDALQITPVDNNNAFSSPLTPDALINFVNDLGYLKVVRTLSDFMTNDMFQPWRALTTIINMCFTGKTSRFTKLIIYYLQSKHKFHPRLDSPLHLPNEEPGLGYLKFSAKGTKREAFGMPILNELITADIQGGSDPDSPAPKPAKATKKSKPSAPKADLRPPVTKPALSQQPKPKPAPAKSQEKKLDKSVNEGIPEKEHRFDDEEADIQKEVEESSKSVHDVPRGPLPLWSLENQTLGNFNRFQRFRERAKRKPGWIKPWCTSEGQARSDPGNDADSQPQSSFVVHARPNLKHMDLEATDVSTHLHPEQIYKGFTATAYPNVQENLKLTVKEQVIIKVNFEWICKWLIGTVLDTMVDVNVNAPADQAPTMAPPTRTDDQIMPHIRWVPIGKSNCYLDVERSQSNPIFKIAVDILNNTNFFRAFTASSTIPSIYIQQFWDTVRYDKIVGCYKF
nr:histone deacetylase 14 [Tanacetum cinerariifolium]